ncbi:327R [Invertebrate iridescent virus Kaz2018]|uniref:327R n=1 Tax=Invertebrate iridescent virus 6 TaxID=176652 RepID=Q91FJ7_IIV6|nr:327R [Invertebrate iridescent virus 6]AAK82188.1 327R [Invertebrate iridescent virus 6]QMS79527.1 hypothetical protein IIV6-T1_320 [Invertebrate iridescent virus 6]QNH08737.1 327R [Invertebrate iridescent virus Kaz2018]
MINDKINAICVNIFYYYAKNVLSMWSQPSMRRRHEKKKNTGILRNKKENFTNKYDFIFKHNR